MDDSTPHNENAPNNANNNVCAPAGDVDIDNVTLARLMAEVRNEDAFEPHAYNRMHNRHNR